MIRGLLVLALFLTPVAAFGDTQDAPDPFELALCIGARVPPLGEDAKYLIKILRPPYSLEYPFHAVPDETRVPLADHNAKHPEAETRALFVGHGGYLLESGLAYQMVEAGFVLFMDVWLGRKAALAPNCYRVRQDAPPRTWVSFDPYAGNAFVARMEGMVLDLVVVDTEGSPVARIRQDLLSSDSLVDRTGDAYVELDGERGSGGFFWFDVGRLRPFVDTYRKVGGEAYARFLSDALLVDWMQSWSNQLPEAEGMRLPYLPSATGEPSGDPRAAIRLEGLRTGPHERFVPGKPRKGGVYGPFVPLLKLLEARDCFREHEEPPSPGSCSAYSVMALQTEFYRAFPDFAEAEGYELWKVFEVLQDRGVCREHLYPMPSGMALGWPGTLDEFAKRSEKALNRWLRRGAPDDPTVAALRESAGGNRIEFVDALPPHCASDMRRYIEQHDLAAHDFVSLYSTQHAFDEAYPGSDAETLRDAQQAELLHLTLRLVDEGIPVMVAGDGGVLDRRAVLAHGRTDQGVVVLDGSIEDEAARRRTVVPLEDLRETLWGIAFLRGEVGESDPTEAQLRRSLAHAPQLDWLHYRLGLLLQEDDRHHEAVDALHRAVELHPDSAYYRKELGESLSEVGRFDEAVEAIGKAIDGGLDEAYNLESLGYALRKLGRLEEAKAAFRRALELDPDRAWGTRQLGWTFHAAGDDVEAESWFRKALALERESLWDQLDYGEFLACVGRGDEARRLMLAAAESDAGAEGLTSIGVRLLVFGYPAEAAALLERSIETESEDEVRSRLWLARAYRALGRADAIAALLGELEERLEALASAEELEPDGWIDLATARAMLGESEACRESIDAFVALRGEPDGGELYELACIHALNGDTERALDALGRAFERGYQDYHWARRDPDLIDLAEDPRFETLVDRYAPDER